MEASTTTPVAADPSENWFRQLKDERLEVSLRVSGLKLRASGPETAVWALVEEFEAQVGVAVEGEWRRPPRTGQRVTEGQLDFSMVLTEEPNGEE